MIRNCFKELEAFLRAQFPVLELAAENADFVVDKITVQDGGHQSDEHGTHHSNFAYDGIIYIERLREDLIPLLLLYIKTWLDDHDQVRRIYSLGDPVADLIKLDEAYQDVMITIPFVDMVWLKEWAEGDSTAPADMIAWDGKVWNVEPFAPDYAEAADVDGAEGGDDQA